MGEADEEKVVAKDIKWQLNSNWFLLSVCNKIPPAAFFFCL